MQLDSDPEQELEILAGQNFVVAGTTAERLIVTSASTWVETERGQQLAADTLVQVLRSRG